MGKHGTEGNPNDGKKEPIGPLTDPTKPPKNPPKTPKK